MSAAGHVRRHRPAHPAEPDERHLHRLRLARRGDDVVLGIVIPLEIHEPLRLRGLHELEEASEAVLLLAEVRLHLAKLVLEARELGRAATRLEVGDHVAEQVELVLLTPVGRDRHLGVALGRPLGELDDVAVGQMPQHLAERAEPVVRLAERRVLAQQRPLDRRRQHRPARRALQPGQRLRDQDGEVVGVLRLRRTLVGDLRFRFHLLGLARRLGGRPLALRAIDRHVDALQRVVEQELVARRRKERRRRILDAHADHALVQLAELVHERREVAVPGADHERRDVVALERHLQRVDRELDVGRVLAHRAHPLGDLDQLDVAAREHPAVLIEVRPVGVGLASDHPSALGQGVQHGPEVELHAVQALPRADGQVLVVQEQGDAFFLGFHVPSVTVSQARGLWAPCKPLASSVRSTRVRIAAVHGRRWIALDQRGGKPP